MTDFYTVLRNALDRVGAVDDADARDRVYGHVRDVMVRRLQTHRPQLSEDDITQRLGEFDAAITRIEEEIAETAFSETDYLEEEPEPVEEAADWTPTALADAPPEQDWRADAATARPDVAWGAAAIDLAWNETTAQWHDPSEVQPQPRLPAGGWEERLGYAVAEERAAPRPEEQPFFAEGEWDDGATPAEPEQPRRRRFGLRPKPAAPSAPPPELETPREASPRKLRWPKRAAEAAAPRTRYEPVANIGAVIDDEAEEPPVRIRRAEPRTAPSDRAIRYLDDRSEESDAIAIAAAAYEAHVVEVEPVLRAEPALIPPAGRPATTMPRRERLVPAPSPALEEEPASRVEAEPRPRRTGRTLTIAVGILALIVAVWCAYVFVPLLFAGDPDGGTVTATTPPATAPQAANTPAAAAPADGTLITIFAGEDPMVFEGGADNPVRYMAEEGGFVRLASSTIGTFRAVIGRGVAERLGGREVELTIEARGSPARPSSSLRVGYLRGGTLLGWQTIGLGAEFESQTMTWNIPAGPGAEADALIIEPGIPGDGTATDIHAIRVRIAS